MRRISNTPQGEAIEGNAADDTLMMHQGHPLRRAALLKKTDDDAVA